MSSDPGSDTIADAKGAITLFDAAAGSAAASANSAGVRPAGQAACYGTATIHSGLDVSHPGLDVSHPLPKPVACPDPVLHPATDDAQPPDHQRRGARRRTP
jgi:hypothetical protein